MSPRPANAFRRESNVMMKRVKAAIRKASPNTNSWVPSRTRVSSLNRTTMNDVR